jgi:hypothetical protein
MAQSPWVFGASAGPSGRGFGGRKKHCSDSGNNRTRGGGVNLATGFRHIDALLAGSTVASIHENLSKSQFFVPSANDGLSECESIWRKIDSKSAADLHHFALLQGFPSPRKTGRHPDVMPGHLPWRRGTATL